MPLGSIKSCLVKVCFEVPPDWNVPDEWSESGRVEVSFMIGAVWSAILATAGLLVYVHLNSTASTSGVQFLLSVVNWCFNKVQKSVLTESPL